MPTYSRLSRPEVEEAVLQRQRLLSLFTQGGTGYKRIGLLLRRREGEPSYSSLSFAETQKLLPILVL